jgi:hypothetical protein
MRSLWSQPLTIAFAASLLCACSDSSDDPTDPAPPPPPPAHLTLTRVVGGQLADLVVSGQLAYVATGRVVATWDYRDPGAPEQVGSPGTGTICTRAGEPATIEAA